MPTYRAHVKKKRHYQYQTVNYKQYALNCFISIFSEFKTGRAHMSETELSVNTVHIFEKQQPNSAFHLP